jgi:hypothetical protein
MNTYEFLAYFSGGTLALGLLIALVLTIWHKKSMEEDAASHAAVGKS